MPKLINHDQRRIEISEAVLKVVGKHGVNGVTMRMVAKEAGWSTGVLHHYFRDKRALLIGGLRLAARLTGKQMKQAMQETDSRQRLRRVIEAGMPLDEQRQTLCRIFFFFWAEGICDAALSTELSQYYSWWKKRLTEIVKAGQQEGWVRQDLQAKLLAEMLVALADGVAVQARFSTRAMSNHRLRKHVNLWIDNLHPQSNTVTGKR